MPGPDFRFFAYPPREEPIRLEQWCEWAAPMTPELLRAVRLHVFEFDCYTPPYPEQDADLELLDSLAEEVEP